jgi:DNA processing protein
MAMNTAQIVQWLKLGQVKGLGPIKLQRLVEIFGSIGRVYNADFAELLDTRIVKSDMLPQLAKLKNDPENGYIRSIEAAISAGMKIVTLVDAEYPLKLKRMPYPPLTLFLWGNAALLAKKKIAVVGTRQPSEEAKKFASESAKYFALNDFVTISGGAQGIDTAAHEGALGVGGKTISVLGNGFFHVYPPQNAPLFERIKQSDGLLVSEYLPNFYWNRYSFIQRNRITSGLSDALLVCASGEKGGSMVQTRIAHEQRIPIFCPALDMNIQPNAGILTVTKNFAGQQIHSPQELLEKLKSRGKLLDTYLKETIPQFGTNTD